MRAFLLALALTGLTMSFDPYNCAELRLGNDSPACPDQSGKRRWYAREQPARNEIGRDEFDSSSASNGAATEIAGPQDVDIRGLIASMPERIPFVQPMPD